MPRQRLPAAKAKITGAAVNHPGRHKERVAPKRTRALGEPFARMTDDQCAAWECFRSELPWLNSSHRALLQVACILRARIDTEAEIGLNALQTYSAVLSKLAATPVDETKVGARDEDEEDPADHFFN